MRRTQLHTVMPWVGGINTSVDPGVMNQQELVKADNVVFSSTGARIKREALEYLDQDLPAPDFRSSSGTTRTLKWTTHPLVSTATPDEKLVVGEKINVTGNANYLASAAAILSRSATAEVTSVTCIADVSGSLAGKYFYLSAGDSGVDYYVWYKVSGTGPDPAIVGRTGIEVDISTNDSASAVATATATAVDALAAFVATPSSAVVTVTAATAGYAASPSAGNSGFTVSVTTEGGHSITYTGGSSLSESSTAAGLTVTRASKVINITDYWRYVSSASENRQKIVYFTDGFQLFSLDDNGRRVQIAGQQQITTVTAVSGPNLTTGQYFLLNGPNNTNKYYVWYNKSGGGGDPAISGRTGIPVAVTNASTQAQVAVATAAAIDALADFVSYQTADVITFAIENATPGVTDVVANGTIGAPYWTATTDSYGATYPVTTPEIIRTLVFNERLLIFFSGVGDCPVVYNPEENAKYQLLGSAGTVPDASFAFKHLGRIWCNDKTNKDYIHYSETFDETKWLGIGDSGALPVFPGDGDPIGITNGYVYKGFAVAAKKDARYRILGDSPENFQVEAISEGLGNEGALAVKVDEQDVVFISKRGIHSQQATDTYGDTAAAYLSAKIKPSFNDFESGKLKYTQGTYIPELNSIAFSIAEAGQTSQNAVWLYNIGVQIPGEDRPGAWYRWPNVSCTALSRVFLDDQHRIIMGTSSGRVVLAQTTNNYADFGTDGILYRVQTGTIYPGQDPKTMKAFKRISIFYRPQGSFQFTVQAKIDNHQAQSFSFSQSAGLDTLGNTFILGTSALGSSSTLAPYTFTMEGYGRGVVLTITQPSADQQIEIWGFQIEYENADLEQEVQD